MDALMGEDVKRLHGTTKGRRILRDQIMRAVGGREVNRERNVAAENAAENGPFAKDREQDLRQTETPASPK